MKIEQINEGLRFGAKERRAVEQESRDIIIGIEYEFHVDEEHASSDEDDFDNEEWREAVYDRAVELMNEDMEGKKEEFLEGYADSEMNEFNVESATASLNSIKSNINNAGFDAARSAMLNDVDDIDSILLNMDDDGLNDDEKEQVGEFLGFMRKFIDTLENIESEAESIEVDDQLDRFAHYLPGDGTHIENNWDGFKDSFESFTDADSTPLDILDDKDELESLQGYTENMVGSINILDDMFDAISGLSGDDGDWDSAIKEGFGESAEDLWDSEREHFLGYDPDNIHESEFFEQAENEIDYSDYSDYSEGVGAVAFVEEKLKNDSEYKQIGTQLENIIEEHAGQVEVITKPLPLKKAMSVMSDMFDFIQEFGSTDSDSGMHVNISIRGLKFHKNNFNYLKMVVLGDVEYMQSEIKYIPRGYVNKLFSELGSKDIFELAQVMAHGGWDMLQGDLTEHLQLNTKKYQAINFRSADDDYESNRIEMRFFGGDNYEHRFDEIKEDIERMAFTVMTGYSEEFGLKEYHKSVLRLLDKLTGKHFDNKIKFLDLSEFAKRNSETEFDALPDGKDVVDLIVGKKLIGPSSDVWRRVR